MDKNSPFNALEDIMSIRSSKEDIANAGILLFLHIYGDKDLQLEKQPYRLYTKMVDKGRINPGRLA